jgi:hypothetical protein
MCLSSSFHQCSSSSCARSDGRNVGEPRSHKEVSSLYLHHVLECLIGQSRSLDPTSTKLGNILLPWRVERGNEIAFNNKLVTIRAWIFSARPLRSVIKRLWHISGIYALGVTQSILLEGLGLSCYSSPSLTLLPLIFLSTTLSSGSQGIWVQHRFNTRKGEQRPLDGGGESPRHLNPSYLLKIPDSLTHAKNAHTHIFLPFVVPLI